MTEWRFERKYPLSSSELMNALNILFSHPAGFHEIYESRVLTNVYFDTPDLSFYHAHLSGDSHRLKVRLRQYNESGEWHLEEKIREGLVGTKKIRPEKLDEAIRSMKGEGPLVLKHSLLYPSLQNRYSRRYFVSSDNKFRITLDEHIEYLVGGHWKASSVHGLLELKYSLDDAEEGERLMKNLPWRMGRFSKYVRGLQFTESLF